LLDDGPLRAGGLGEGLQLGDGHFDISFVVQSDQILGLGIFFGSGGAEEEGDAAGARVGNEVDGFGSRQGSGEDVDPIVGHGVLILAARDGGD